jgi:hypothetical protein
MGSRLIPVSFQPHRSSASVASCLVDPVRRGDRVVLRVLSVGVPRFGAVPFRLSWDEGNDSGVLRPQIFFDTSGIMPI